MEFDARWSGNHDRALGRSERAGSWETYAQSLLSPEACQALAMLPATLDLVPGVLACHGTPASDTSYLLEDVHDGRLVQATEATIALRLAGIGARLVLCGHSHLPRTLTNGAQSIVNPGSVGCPAYLDTGSPYHCSEAGSPHARYAIVDDKVGAWAVEHLAVPYDWARAADRARQNNQPDWATALLTGRVGR